MAPRRPRSSSNVSSSTIPRAPTSSPQLRKQFAASIDSIYHNNITVLQRRDPSVLSIMDQFSHVCLYHFNGKKWEKQGFEGSMFLVEHQEYPPYGMYILNRMGTGDYERRLYPEDDMEVLGDYLMYRYYPDFTKKRLEMKLPYPLPPQYKPIFDKEFSEDNSVPEQVEKDSKREKKGNSVTLGLWMFPSDAREPLKDVMLRLHSYIKSGESYPEEYRYGPSRPPPPNPHLSRANHSSSQLQHARNDSQSTSTGPIVLNQVVGESEVDKLFAKLQPQPTQTSSIPPSEPPHTSPRSVQSWFTALAGQNLSSQSHLAHTPPAPIPAQQAVIDPSPTPSRGLALLNTIFASVSQPMDTMNGTFPRVPPLTGSNSQQPIMLPPRPEKIQIVSPKPHSTALPQILSQNVISTLLGLAPDSSGSRASSAAPSSNSSRQSAANRYEGDNEMSENEASEGKLPTGPMTLEPQIARALAGSSSLPSVAHPHTADGSDAPTPNASVQGDVTPRAVRGVNSASPAPSSQRSGQPFLTVTSTVSTITSTQRPDIAKTVSTPIPAVSTSADARARALVPFSADSELWPYPRAPLNDNEQTSDGDADVVELDFSDTRALSDPTIFKEKQARQQGKGERKKKTRKERAADREKERDAIENGWDDPTKGQVTISGLTTIISNGHNGAPSSSSAVTNGVTNDVAAPSPGVSHNGVNGAVNSTADEARVALLAALAKQPKAPSRDLTRKQFVQEVLALIYSDSSFVDKLYQEYISS